VEKKLSFLRKTFQDFSPHNGLQLQPTCKKEEEEEEKVKSKSMQFQRAVK